MARGHVQFETGYTVVRSRDDLTSLSVPELLVRIGVLPGAEFRVSETFRSIGQTSSVVAVSGWDDLQLGTKIRLLPQQGLRPAFSTEVFASFATGAALISAHRTLPGAALLAEWDSDGPWSAGAELQGARGADSGLGSAASLSIQYRPSDPLQFYGEVYTLQSTASGSPGEFYFNTGVLLLLSNDVQIDARFGVGLNHAALKNFFGMGFALRR